MKTVSIITKTLVDLYKDTQGENFEKSFKRVFVTSLLNSWQDNDLQWSREVRQAFNFNAFIFTIEMDWNEVYREAQKQKKRKEIFN